MDCWTSRIALSLLLCAIWPACRRVPAGPASPPTPEALCSALLAAAQTGDAAAVYGLLDTKSRWSIMSVFQDQQKICSLVRGTYPKDRQARELERCHLADGKKDDGAFFVAYANADRVMERLARLIASKPPAARPIGPDRAVLEIQGTRIDTCREGAHWTFCGLRPELEKWKVKTARDVATIRESAETFRTR
jgi:hypothetical protein